VVSPICAAVLAEDGWAFYQLVQPLPRLSGTVLADTCDSRSLTSATMLKKTDENGLDFHKQRVIDILRVQADSENARRMRVSVLAL
jgi:hypothetical protein